MSDTQPSTSIPLRKRLPKEVKVPKRTLKITGLAASTGRPLAIITPEQRAELLGAFERGLDVLTACGLAGVSPHTFARWLQEENGFRAAVEKSRAAHIDAAFARLRELPAGRWQAAAWELERLYPERFGQGFRPDFSQATVKVEVTATLCAEMHDSWKRFQSQVIEAKEVTNCQTHNDGYVQSKIESGASPSKSATSGEKEGQAPPGEAKGLSLSAEADR